MAGGIALGRIYCMNVDTKSFTTGGESGHKRR